MNDQQASTVTASSVAEAPVEGGAEERPHREPLSRDRIIRAALRIMDEEGLDAVTMRRVGRELGVEAMSLYNHVRGKEDVLDGIIQGVLREFRITRGADWTESTRLAAREFRRLLVAHPSVMKLMIQRDKPFTNADSLQVYEYIFELLHEAGLSGADSGQAFHVFGGYILGAVTLELGLMVGGPSDDAHEQGHQEMAQLIALADLPRLREVMPYLIDCDMDQQFEFGLDLLIEGLRSRVAASS